MELKEAIIHRRSIRSFEERKLSKDIIRKLIALGVHAPTASNAQPWAFAVVEDQKLLKEWSDQSKAMMLKHISDNPGLIRYKAMMENDRFSIFGNAPCLLIIYGDISSPNYLYDCSMVAQNIMLLALEEGLGSCWVGSATHFGDTPNIKEKLGIPQKYALVAPIILGYPTEKLPVSERKEPIVLSWT